MAVVFVPTTDLVLLVVGPVIIITVVAINLVAIVRRIVLAAAASPDSAETRGPRGWVWCRARAVAAVIATVSVATVVGVPVCISADRVRIGIRLIFELL